MGTCFEALYMGVLMVVVLELSCHFVLILTPGIEQCVYLFQYGLLGMAYGLSGFYFRNWFPGECLNDGEGPKYIHHQK